MFMSEATYSQIAIVGSPPCTVDGITMLTGDRFAFPFAKDARKLRHVFDKAIICLQMIGVTQRIESRYIGDFIAKHSFCKKKLADYADLSLTVLGGPFFAVFAGALLGFICLIVERIIFL